MKLPKSFQISFFFILFSTGFMAFSRRQLEMVIQSQVTSFNYLFVIDTTGVIVSALLMPIAGYFAYHNPVWKYTWHQVLRRYLILNMTYIFTFVTCSSILKYVVFNLYELTIPTRDVWIEVAQSEVSGQFFLLNITIVIVNVIYFEQVRLIKTEQNLAQERLQSLQNQLNPHFLFNTLNTISAMMYQDVKAADRMIERLSELLRAALMLGNSVEITVEEELALLNAYTSIMQERFPTKFEVNVTCDPDLRYLLIPPLLLQPLVENCIKHGQFDARHPTRDRGQVEVLIKAHEHVLELCVLDNGDGHIKNNVHHKSSQSVSMLTQRAKEQTTQSRSSTAYTQINRSGGGVGLKVTKDRLRLIYGKEASITFGFRRDQPGYKVKVVLPLLATQKGSGMVLTRLPTPT